MAQELKITREDKSDDPDFIKFGVVDDDAEMQVSVTNDKNYVYTFFNKADAEAIVSYLKQQFKL